jgi:hypothetical protein
MSTSMRLLPVRTTDRLRAVIDRVGSVNAATRALLIVGAHSSGLDLDGLDREIALLLAEDLDQNVAGALRHVYGTLMDRQEPQCQQSSAAPIPAPVSLVAMPEGVPAAEEVPAMDDPFSTIGVEV